MVMKSKQETQWNHNYSLCQANTNTPTLDEHNHTVILGEVTQQTFFILNEICK